MMVSGERRSSMKLVGDFRAHARSKRSRVPIQSGRENASLSMLGFSLRGIWLSACKAVWLAGFLFLLGCGPRPPVRHPGISGLERDWTEALMARSPALLAALFRDQRLERAPGLSLSPGPRLGARLVSLRWMPNPKSPLGPGLLGQVSVLESVSYVRVQRLAFHALGERRAHASLRIRLDGRVRGGYPRSDMGVMDVVLWRRAYHGPWYVAELRAVSLVTIVGLGQAFVDRTTAWLPGDVQRPDRSGALGVGRGLVAADDFDGDGSVDLAWWDGRWISFWRRSGDGFQLWGGRLPVTQNLGSGGDKMFWRLVDRQGDGSPELLLGRNAWVEFSKAGPKMHRTRALAGKVVLAPTDQLPRSLLDQLGKEARFVVSHVSLDIDQDGRDEHLVVMRDVAKGASGAANRSLRLYWWLPGRRAGSTTGRWVDVAHAAGLPRRVLDVAAADFDGDGGMDLALVTRDGLKIFRNLFDRGQWARLVIRGSDSMPLVGAEVTVTGPDGRLLVRRPVGTRGLPLTSVMVGLGRFDRADVTVRFRDGKRVVGRLEAGRTTLLSPGRGREVGSGGTGTLGPGIITDRVLREWLGRSSETNGMLRGDMVLLLCSGGMTSPCRKMADRASKVLAGRGETTQVVLAWLSPPVGKNIGGGRWTETVLDRDEASKYRRGGWLPRVLLYRGGVLRSVLVRPGTQALMLELEALSSRAPE